MGPRCPGECGVRAQALLRQPGPCGLACELATLWAGLGQPCQLGRTVAGEVLPMSQQTFLWVCGQVRVGQPGPSPLSQPRGPNPGAELNKEISFPKLRLPSLQRLPSLPSTRHPLA